MEQQKGKTLSPLSAACDAGSSKSTGDSPQVNKDELKEDRKESQGVRKSVIKDEVSIQSYIFDCVANRPIWDSAVWEELSPSSVPEWTYGSSSASPYSSRDHRFSESKKHLDPVLPSSPPLQRAGLNLQGPSLERESKHGSPSFPIPLYFSNQSAYSPLTKRYSAGMYQEAGDALEAKKKAPNEDRKESLHKNQENQTSISEKPVTEDEKFSAEGVQVKLPTKNVPGFLHGSTSTSSYSSSNPEFYGSLPKYRKRSYPVVISSSCQQGIKVRPQGPSLGRESEHGSPSFPILPYFSNQSAYSSLPASYGAGTYQETALVLEPRKESLHKNQENQTSISEKTVTEDEKFSTYSLYDMSANSPVSAWHGPGSNKSTVQDELSRKSVPEFLYGSSSYSLDSSRGHKFCESRKHPDPVFPSSPPRQQTRIINQGPSLGRESEHGRPSFPIPTIHFQPSLACILSTSPDSPTVPQPSKIIQTSISEKAGTEDEEFSAEGVGDKLCMDVDVEAAVTAVNYSVTNTLPAQCHLQTSSSDPGSSCLPRSHSVPSLSQRSSARNESFRRAQSLPDMLLKSSSEEFTPVITVDENDESYRFQCSCPGLYQCSVTGLMFNMEGEGDVVYRMVPWNRRLLAQHHKRPAGPLFDIKCVQQSVRQLHLPHCEIRSTGGCDFLSVAHVNDEGVEFIVPHQFTDTHVVIYITGFSGFGNVKDEDSAPDPVRALVLLFYRPPADPDPTSLLNVLLLPRNVVLRDVLRTRKKLVGDEIYMETSPHCKLQPQQEYTLSTCPEDDSLLVQPTEAEFDCDDYDNYFPSFQVSLEKLMKHMKLILRDASSSHSVWERRVCLSSAGVKRWCGSSALNVPPGERLLDVRSSFIDGISGPVLKSLLDKLFERTVMTDSERESADEMQNKRDKARFVIDTVRRKGEAASSEMIEFLCEADPFLCEHLGLI